MECFTDHVLNIKLQFISTSHSNITNYCHTLESCYIVESNQVLLGSCTSDMRQLP